jgi:hypothetical protein
MPMEAPSLEAFMSDITNTYDHERRANSGISFEVCLCAKEVHTNTGTI